MNRPPDSATDLFWKGIADRAQQFLDQTPEGMAAHVEIETGDGTIYRPGMLQDQRQGSWLMLHLQVGDDRAYEIVLIREQNIRRIRFFREPSEKPSVGFSFRVEESE